MSPSSPLSEALASDRAAALALVHVSRETLRRLDGFAALFLQWQAKLNLVAPSTLPHLWTRHIADSLQLVGLVPGAKVWIDLGSGGGFPGLMIACALAGEEGAQVHLVESNSRKAAFLREAARTLQVPARVHVLRIEAFAARWNGSVDAVTARALAPLTKLIGLAAPLLKTGAAGLFPKGQDVGDELTEAAKSWRIEAELVPSLTDPRGRIVILRSAARLRNSP